MAERRARTRKRRSVQDATGGVDGIGYSDRLTTTLQQPAAPHKRVHINADFTRTHMKKSAEIMGLRKANLTAMVSAVVVGIRVFN